MTTDKLAEALRDSFERWVVMRHGYSRERWHDTGKYKYGNTGALWECWNQALQAHAAEVEPTMTLHELAARIGRGEKWKPATEPKQPDSLTALKIPNGMNAMRACVHGFQGGRLRCEKRGRAGGEH